MTPTSRTTPGRVRPRRRLWFGAALLAGLALACSAVLADGDPASDVLLAQNVFYPYNPPVLPALEKTLNGETAAAARAGFHIKVAIIGAPYDLGVVPEMFGHAQTYANFLDRELRLFLGPHPPLLVVMPDGYGQAELPGPAQGAVVRLAKPIGRGTNSLVRAAITAIPKLATAAGHPVAAGAGDGGDSGGESGGSPLTIVIVVLVAAGLAAGVLLARRRQARAASRTRGRRGA